MARTKSKATGSGIEAVNAAGTTITPEYRRRMIAEAAYYRAEKRGFKGGDAMSDWLDAEHEIDSMLMNSPVAVASETDGIIKSAMDKSRAGTARHVRRSV